MARKMTEIRWHARGGQGAKTAATLLAIVAVGEGKYAQGFPDYGPERQGAPIRGYTRISDAPIHIHSAIYEPDVVVVLDATLLEVAGVCEGLREDGVIIVNTPASPAEIRERLGLKDGKVFTVDATQISIEEIGRAFPNAPMMGALVKLVPVIQLDGILADVKKKFSSKGERIVEGNTRAIKRAYEEVRSE